MNRYLWINEKMANIAVPASLNKDREKFSVLRNSENRRPKVEVRILGTSKPERFS